MRFLVKSLPVTTLALLLTACELTAKDIVAIEGGFADPRETPPPPPNIVPAPSCFAKRSVQPEGQISRKIDILFVADTSGSLQEERGDIANGIDSFVGALPANVDYRVGVLLGHGPKSSWYGKLYRYGSEPAVLSSSTMTLNDIRTKLRNKLTQTADDMDTDGGEAGMLALTQAVSASRLAESRTAGFFRNDAALAVVFIADENDICAQYPAGVTPVVDTEGRELPAKAKYCSGITPLSVVNTLKAVQGDRPMLVSSIAYKDAYKVPRVGENEVAYGIIETVAMAGGLTIELADGHYDTGLMQIGTLAMLKLELLTEFKLAEDNIDASTIKVLVDGSHRDHSWIEPTKTVHVASPGGARSVVDITYCEKGPVVDDPPGGGGDDGGGGGPILD